MADTLPQVMLAGHLLFCDTDIGNPHDYFLIVEGIPFRKVALKPDFPHAPDGFHVNALDGQRHLRPIKPQLAVGEKHQLCCCSPTNEMCDFGPLVFKTYSLPLLSAGLSCPPWFL